MSSDAALRFTGGATTATLVLRHSPSAKTMRLRVDPRTGSVLLTVPRRISERRAIAWAGEQRHWIEAALADIPAPPPLGPGASVPLHGEPHIVEWRQEAPRAVYVTEGRIVTGGPGETVAPRLLRWLRVHALDLLVRETSEYAAAAGVEVGRVAIGDPISRWGSCSATGSIRYSWRLILAPDWVRRATVAHEVAHRIHMNHGPAFHRLVAELLGHDPGPARQWLRRNGASLHRFGRL
jgi:predicted metal-dependent hydrolase